MSKFGTSLLVPSVQELAKKPNLQVPEQYLHPNQDSLDVSNTTSLEQVPIIELSKLLSEDATELEKLDHACREWGFFQLINHGVDPSLVENVKIGVQEFLSLPVDDKKKFQQTPEDMEGFGQLFVVSENQKLEWADLFFTTTLPNYARNPRLFPNIPQPLRDNLENYCLDLKRVCIAIIKYMEKALKVESNEMLEIFDDITQSMRMNYYPLCPQPENVIGLNPHSDAAALTILLQANDIEGLQIRKDGQWITIKPFTNAFVINVGDILEILTNGIYRSIEHRATVNSKKERISIAAFHRPQMSKVIGPTPTLVTPEKPALFKTLIVEDYYKTFFSRQLQRKSCLDLMRIQNENSK
ncbi:protein SRG1-like [Vicia villosa]|uniref:protein SRG1-like n=1 Tax=Vicia villosa TaxID=3911 RepID=UPI00273BFE88|nr:protein SRG1-like [Vicia villosa]XP_058775671.1 protein SRG1-like [Vicia villosa]